MTAETWITMWALIAVVLATGAYFYLRHQSHKLDEEERRHRPAE